MQVAADAECCACSLRTVAEIMMKAASSTALDVSNGLPNSSNGQHRTQFALSALVQMVLLMRLQQKKWGSDPSAGSKHRGNGTLPFFRLPRKARWRRMNGQSPTRRDRNAPRHGEHEEAISASGALRMTRSSGAAERGGVGSRTRPT